MCNEFVWHSFIHFAKHTIVQLQLDCRAASHYWKSWSRSDQSSKLTVQQVMHPTTMTRHVRFLTHRTWEWNSRNSNHWCFVQRVSDIDIEKMDVEWPDRLTKHTVQELKVATFWIVYRYQRGPGWSQPILGHFWTSKLNLASETSFLLGGVTLLSFCVGQKCFWGPKKCFVTEK